LFLREQGILLRRAIHVARFVAGSDAPPWLAAHFERWASSLQVDRFVHEMQPTKAEMKKRLAEVKDAALLLRDALNARL
jgi:hypothetical protein